MLCGECALVYRWSYLLVAVWAPTRDNLALVQCAHFLERRTQNRGHIGTSVEGASAKMEASAEDGRGDGVDVAGRVGSCWEDELPSSMSSFKMTLWR